MSDEFPGNSHAGKVPQAKKKVVKKVVSGEVTQKKKPWWKRAKESFTGDDTRTVGSYIWFDILIPAFKDAVSDAVSQGVDRKLFGEARSRGRRGHNSVGGVFASGVSQVAYNRMAGSTLRPDPRQQTVNRGRVRHRDLEEIYLGTRAEASAVLDQMIEIIANYDWVSVADLFEMLGVTGEYTDEKFGWDDLRGADVQRTADGYLLILPHPVEITR